MLVRIDADDMASSNCIVSGTTSCAFVHVSARTNKCCKTTLTQHKIYVADVSGVNLRWLAIEAVDDAKAGSSGKERLQAVARLSSRLPECHNAWLRGRQWSAQGNL